MHLALVISSLNAGGAERVLSELANYWASKGHRISMITLMSLENQPFYQLDYKINLICLNQSKNDRFWVKRLLNIVKRICRLRAAIHQIRPDVVVSFVDVTNILTLIATKGYGIPVVVSERIDPSFHVLPKLYIWLRLRLYPLCSRLIVQIESAAQYFPENFKKFLQIIPNPVRYPKSYKKGLKIKVQKIITVGRLDPQKDHVTLIHAFSDVVRHYPHLTLTIYGEGKERETLENLVTSLGLEDKIYLPGITPHIQACLLKSDIFVFPSLYEGFPNALCEAMSIGLPVIASNCSGNVDIVCDGANGRLFPMGSAQSLAAILLELLEDFDQRARLAENARNICARFHRDRIFDLWDKIINDVLNNQ